MCDMGLDDTLTSHVELFCDSFDMACHIALEWIPYAYLVLYQTPKISLVYLLYKRLNHIPYENVAHGILFLYISEAPLSDVVKKYDMNSCNIL